MNHYAELIENMAQTASNRSDYKGLVAHLRGMLEYPSGDEVVESIVETWKTVNKSRPAMMDALCKM